MRLGTTTGATIVSVAAALMWTPVGAVNASPAEPSALVARSTPTVTVSVPDDKVEDDRFAVTVKVGAARRGLRLELQQQTLDIYWNLVWTTIKSVKVAGRSSIRFASVADELNDDRFRAVVRYVDGSHVTSKPAAVTVWHWSDLSWFDPYYETADISINSLSQFNMNGDEYVGWYTWGAHDMWESRYTPGRNCKAFRGVFGVRDESSDGSSGTFTLIADETEVVYESPALTPGMVEAVEIKIPNPYRFAIQARDTSPEGAYSGPAIGTPQFLCTGY